MLPKKRTKEWTWIKRKFPIYKIFINSTYRKICFKTCVKVSSLLYENHTTQRLHNNENFLCSNFSPRMFSETVWNLYDVKTSPSPITNKNFRKLWLKSHGDKNDKITIQNAYKSKSWVYTIFQIFQPLIDGLDSI